MENINRQVIVSLSLVALRSNTLWKGNFFKAGFFSKVTAGRFRYFMNIFFSFSTHCVALRLIYTISFLRSTHHFNFYPVWNRVWNLRNRLKLKGLSIFFFTISAAVTTLWYEATKEINLGCLCNFILLSNERKYRSWKFLHFTDFRRTDLLSLKLLQFFFYSSGFVMSLYPSEMFQESRCGVKSANRKESKSTS